MIAGSVTGSYPGQPGARHRRRVPVAKKSSVPVHGIAPCSHNSLRLAHEAAALASAQSPRRPRQPAHCGPASDALFLEAMKAAAPVVVIQGVDPPLVTETAIFTA